MAVDVERDNSQSVNMLGATWYCNGTRLLTFLIRSTSFLLINASASPIGISLYIMLPMNANVPILKNTVL